MKYRVRIVLESVDSQNVAIEMASYDFAGHARFERVERVFSSIVEFARALKGSWFTQS